LISRFLSKAKGSYNQIALIFYSKFDFKVLEQSERFLFFS